MVRNLPDEPLEGHLAEEKVGALLVLSDLPEGDGAWVVAMCFLARNACEGGGDMFAAHRLPWGLARFASDMGKVLDGSVLAACH